MIRILIVVGLLLGMAQAFGFEKHYLGDGLVVSSNEARQIYYFRRADNTEVRVIWTQGNGSGEDGKFEFYQNCESVSGYCQRVSRDLIWDWRKAYMSDNYYTYTYEPDNCGVCNCRPGCHEPIAPPMMSSVGDVHVTSDGRWIRKWLSKAKAMGGPLGAFIAGISSAFTLYDQINKKMKSDVLITYSKNNNIVSVCHGNSSGVCTASFAAGQMTDGPDGFQGYTSPVTQQDMAKILIAVEASIPGRDRNYEICDRELVAKSCSTYDGQERCRYEIFCF